MADGNSSGGEGGDQKPTSGDPVQQPASQAGSTEQDSAQGGSGDQGKPITRSVTKEHGTELLVVPPTTSGKSKASSRTPSPHQLIRNFESKVNSQNSRLEMLHALVEPLYSRDYQFSVEELDCLARQLTDIHLQFEKQHAILETSVPAEHENHPYFADNVMLKEMILYNKALSSITIIKSRLKPSASTHQNIQPASHQLPPWLTGIKLPTFSGCYSEWPSFKDQMKSLVIDQPSISNVTKFYLFQSNLKGPAAQLIGGLNMVEESLGIAWKKLHDQYENRRILIKSQLDKLFGDTSRIQGDAESVNQLITTVTQAISVLKSLKHREVDHWDSILVYYITQRLDRFTKEKWEVSLGSGTDYPTYHQLMEFLSVRVRSLEALESSREQKSVPRTSSSSSTTQHQAKRTPVSSHHASGQSSLSESKLSTCDCCQGYHYIAFCDDFHALSSQERKAMIHSKQLCINCFGRHFKADCKSERRCKKCSQKHHTLLHEAFYPSKVSGPPTSLPPPPPEVQAKINQAISKQQAARQEKSQSASSSKSSSQQ